MALFKQKNSLFDPLRDAWVVATPEEIVRQKLLHIMIEKLGYPKHFLAVEKQLSEIPHLAGRKDLPTRRADILCFAKGDDGLYPLLLVECKEGQAGPAAKAQALGYNHFVKAPFVAIAGYNHTGLVVPYETSFLPSYESLLEHACN